MADEALYRHFHLIDPANNHRKFWSISKIDATASGFTSWFEVRWGRIGTAGQSKTFHFPYGSEALASYSNRIAEKLREGYVEKLGLGAEVVRAAVASGTLAEIRKSLKGGMGVHRTLSCSSAGCNKLRAPDSHRCADCNASIALCVDNTKPVPTLPLDVDDLSVFELE